jgi:hypothetical protein
MDVGLAVGLAPAADFQNRFAAVDLRCSLVRLP